MAHVKNNFKCFETASFMSKLLPRRIVISEIETQIIIVCIYTCIGNVCIQGVSLPDRRTLTGDSRHEGKHY